MPKGKRTPLDPDDVLAGRVRPGVRELIALIHSVNPSGREHLGLSQVAHRYAQKSRLQSLLVQLFASDIDVEPAPGQPHLATLRHRPTKLDACHAVIAELDDEARAWVQLALDVEAQADRAEPPMRSPSLRPLHVSPPSWREPGSVSELVAAADEARDAYDYELARHHLELAVAQGSDEAATRLLELLVDTLGADDEALALIRRIPKALAAHPEARALMAMAHARTGDRTAALALVASGVAPLAAPRKGAVFLALARKALEGGDVLAAVHDILEARLHTPTAPDLVGLMAAIEGLRAPHEEAAQRAFDEGKLDEATALSEEVLARFGESKVAGRIRRLCEEERRKAYVEKLLAEVEALVESGQLGRARPLLQRARAEGVLLERAASIEKRLVAFEEAQLARTVAARVEQVANVLGGPNPASGFAAYLDLDASARASVRALRNLAQLTWLDEIGAHGGSGSRALAAIQAVLSLSRAESLVHGNPQTALDILAPHRKVLAPVTHAQRVLRDAQRAVAELRKKHATQQLEAAEHALSEGAEDCVRSAEYLLSQVLLGELNDEGRARAQALEERIQGILARRSRRKNVDELRMKGELLKAIQAVKGFLVTTDEPTERKELIALSASLTEDVRTAYDLRVEKLPPGTQVRLAGPEPRDPCRSILPGGKELVIAATHGLWIFLWVIDIDSATVRERVRLRGRFPIRMQRLVLEGGYLHLFGGTGSALVLDPSTWLPVTESESDQSPDLDGMAALSPGGETVWAIDTSGKTFTTTIWDLTRGQWAERTNKEAWEAQPRSLFGLSPHPGTADAPAIAVLHGMVNETIGLYTVYGTLISSYRKIWILEETLVVHPAGDTLFGITISRSDDTQPVTYRMVELDQKAVPLRLDNPDDRNLHFPGAHNLLQTVVDCVGGLIYFRLGNRGDPNEILAVQTPPRGAQRPIDGSARPAKPIFRVPAPGRTRLVEDPAGGAAVAIAVDQERFEVVRLGASPPVFRTPSSEPDAPVPSSLRLTDLGRCTRPAGRRLPRIRQLGTFVLGASRRQIRARIHTARREGVIPLLDLIAAIEECQEAELLELGTQEAIEAYPDHPEVLLLDARLLLYDMKWDLMGEKLQRIDATQLEPTLLRHYHHFLGLTLLMMGERAKALDVLRRAEAEGGKCDLNVGIALAMPLDDPEAETRTWDGEQLALRALMRSVTDGDAHLQAGDACGAVRVLDTLLIHDAQEVQSLARLAQAYLDLPNDVPIDPFVKAQALAGFHGAHSERGPFTRRELPLSFPRWDTARLDALSDRARAWLDQPAGGEPSRGAEETASTS